MSEKDFKASEGVIAYTDGAAKGNPGPGGWGVVLRLPNGTIEEMGGRAQRTTNNRMEIEGVLRLLERLSREPGPLCICTDSTYVMKGATEWMSGWKRRGWVTASGGPVANRDQWEEMESMISARTPRPVWRHVRGHAGVPGNERADRIASAEALGESPEKYRGSEQGYGYDLSLDAEAIPTEGGTAASPASKSRKKGRAHSYLSLVHGRALRHRNWSDCERAVKGRAGARYRKAMTASEERQILTDWGVSPADVVDA